MLSSHLNPRILQGPGDMKGVFVLELLRPLTHIRITAFVLLSSSLFYLGHRSSSSSVAAAAAGYHQHSSFSLSLPETSPAAVPSPSSGNSSRLSSILNIPSLPPTQPPAIERTGIVDENGVMTTDFEVGVSEPGLDEAWEDSNPTNKEDGGVEKRWSGSSSTRFKVCGERMEEYIPCLGNAEAVEGLVSRERGEQYERHCPGEGNWVRAWIAWCRRPRGIGARSLGRKAGMRFSAAMHDLEIGSWVMNVVRVSGFNTLPVIYNRGLIGVTHDWCEPFDTYPRTYDLLHATGLFSVERQRCNISSIMLEMDRMLRPGRRAYIRDSV